MPDIERVKGSMLGGQVAFTIFRPLSPVLIHWLTTTGAGKLWNWLGWPAVNVVAERKEAMVAMAAVSAARQIFWGWYLSVNAFEPGMAIGISIFNTLIDSINTLSAMRSPSPWDNLDKVGVALFALGSFGETFSELLRHWWKQRPENKGKPYTGGLFAFSTNFNYFGYTVWRLGMSLVGKNWTWTAIHMAHLCYDFTFSAIPGKEKHNAAKYGEAYTKYAEKTAKFIPFIW